MQRWVHCAVKQVLEGHMLDIGQQTEHLGMHGQYIRACTTDEGTCDSMGDRDKRGKSEIQSWILLTSKAGTLEAECPSRQAKRNN